MKRLLVLCFGGLAAVAIAAFALAPAASAHGGGCRHANARPKAVPSRVAAHAVGCLINHRRRAHGLGALRIRHKLHKSSRNHTNYMLRHSCFEHDCPGEATLDSRLREVDYLTGGLRRWAYGENIAWGKRRHATPKAMVRAWMHSPSHRANILSASFHDLGVGLVWATFSSRHAHGGVYTTDFGLRRR